MKIKRIYIKNFGNISDFSIEPENSFSIIRKDSDIDQIALVNFLTIMLFGASQADKNSIRFRYEPTNGMAMAGCLTLEINNVSYSIERTFSSTVAEDTIKITDLSSDKEISVPENETPGSLLLSITQYDFERCIYILPLIIPTDSKLSVSDLLTEMLINFVSSGDEKTSYKKICSRLDSNELSGKYEMLSSRIREKNLQISSLRSELNQARIEETTKLKEQHDCIALKKKFDKINEQCEKLNTDIKVQELLAELEQLKKSEISHDNFLDISDSYEKKSSEFHNMRADRNKEVFNECKSIYSAINENIEIRKSLDASRASVSAEVNKYIPQDNAEILDTICEAKSQISDISYSVRQLQNLSNEKQQELIKLHEKITDAKYRLKTAENEYSHFEEISQHRILLAEEKLHNASELVNTEPPKLSSNFILSLFLTIALALLLIVFLNNIVMVVIICAVIASVVYAICDRLTKSKKNKLARVNENNLRDAEREMRGIKNKYSTEKDGHRYKVESEKDKYKKLLDTEKSLKEEIEKLGKRILQTKENLNFYQKQKSLEEAKITPPDPRFFAFKDQLKKIEDSIVNCDNENKTMCDKLFSSVKSLSQISSISEALDYMEKAVALENSINELNSKLLAYNNKDKSDSESFKLKIKIKALEEKIFKLNSKKNAVKLTPEQFIKLQDKANKTLNESLRTKDEYINAVTNLKLQYKDSLNVACTDKRLTALQNALVVLENKQNIKTIVSETLDESLRSFKKDHKEVLITRISDIFKKLNPGKPVPEIASEDDLKMAADNIMKMPADSTQSADKTLNSLYLAMRMAFVELISDNNTSMPFIIDDAFIRQSDDSISKAKLDFFRSYSEKTQVLISSSDKTLTQQH
ncbi:MAG: hypothetical protein Q4F95_03005 [Oscillospiraceae bacterium]|nr:hypothetical protein [Oscillospiraceae bacterium]